MRREDESFRLSIIAILLAVGIASLWYRPSDGQSMSSNNAYSIRSVSCIPTSAVGGCNLSQLSPGDVMTFVSGTNGVGWIGTSAGSGGTPSLITDGLGDTVSTSNAGGINAVDQAGDSFSMQGGVSFLVAPGGVWEATDSSGDYVSVGSGVTMFSTSGNTSTVQGGTATLTDGTDHVTVASGFVTLSGGGNNVTLTAGGSGLSAKGFYPTSAIPLGRQSFPWSIFFLSYTNTATVGSVTINESSGTVNMASGASTLTVTDSFCAGTSRIFVTAGGNPGLAVSLWAVPGSGSFTINASSNLTNQTPIMFIVIN